MKEIKGNLIDLGLEGHFDIIVHGCNCFCTMGAGIAKEIKERIPDAWRADQRTHKGDIMKLGNYTFADLEINDKGWLTIINAYTQYRYGPNHEDGDKKPVDYDAIRLAMRKINHNYKKKSIGIPLIGAGLAGGDWEIIKKIIQQELKDMDVTIVHFKK